MGFNISTNPSLDTFADWRKVSNEVFQLQRDVKSILYMIWTCSKYLEDASGSGNSNAQITFIRGSEIILRHQAHFIIEFVQIKPQMRQIILTEGKFWTESLIFKVL